MAIHQKTTLLFWALSFFFQATLLAEDGYRLWLRYDKIADESTRLAYLEQLEQIVIVGNGPILSAARQELSLGLAGLLGQFIPEAPSISQKRSLILGMANQATPGEGQINQAEKDALQREGFILKQIAIDGKKHLLVLGKDEQGVLYGTFRLLQLLQRCQPLDGLYLNDYPKVQHRILNHWDNLDRTVERGYAGFSIWDWHQLPEFLYPQYTDYARANASIGINGAVVTNVNANSLVFRPDYLQKAAALADVFRPYGIKLYLTARFSAPIELGGLPTADPLNVQVQDWWKQKVEEIYQYIPDFGGFLVKANSEGQPGPQDYGRNHADGANMLADALAPYGGIVMWRAFVYSHEVPDDRSKQAYHEFVPLDGSFRANVLIQVKNGPIDFQPREPIHPLFGAMPNTPVMMEFQITKEYLGQGTHLVGLANLYEEVLQTDTHVKGTGSTVAQVIDGSLHGYERTGMAGVANIGTARNWTGNLFGQADWYAFGRLAWNPHLKAETMFIEWSELTFGLDSKVVETVVQLLRKSYEACVQYMTPIGLHHIMGPGHHYGPGPWVKDMPRADWTSVYYHKADEGGIGFDRTDRGSDALSQYHPDFSRQFADPKRCPLPFLLWFHHLPWDFKLATGRDVWEELCWQYHQGVVAITAMKGDWEAIQPYIDAERFQQVQMHLEIQEKEAKWWRDACLAYFQSFSKRDVPNGLEKPAHELEFYESLSFPYAPGIRPRW
ncbi:MAG TPA: alpha-glucuronidase family glycosyl hydrolase [Saprospiraceae bacterium]|nr:alpha-glucuronidase family glycosyl hydrolase [Saprospiraceae bacterium]HMQ81700.1 alpha-glucuronidase family glycosyl hydrolase [Saprospiraceae bacterium]